MINFLETLGLHLWCRVWDIADHVFKLASWGLLLAGLFAVNSKHPTSELVAITAVLSVLWLTAMLASVIKAGTALLDKCAEHIVAFKLPWLRLLLHLVAVLSVTQSVVGLARAVTIVFAHIIDVSMKANP
jgi:hypothetical protein